MIVQHPVYHYARVTLEALTAHAIGSGREDVTHDMLLVRDANGLPTIPATSLAGVLRHLYQQRYGQTAAEALFGHLGRTDHDDGKASRVHFTWALVHDSQNRPLEGLREDAEHDPLLSRLLVDHPLVRQRVRLNHRGAAADTGKFDTTLVPAGTRYTCFIAHWSDGGEAADEAWQSLLNLLTEPTFRLGRGTRAGSGAFKVQQLSQARWDLRTSEGQTGYCQRPRRRADDNGLSVQQLPKSASTIPHVSIALEAEAGWRIGGGEAALGDYSDTERKKEPDILPQSEPVIRWENDTATWELRRPVIPAAAVKGALAHRVNFHYRRLTGAFANTGAVEDAATEAVRALFGYANDDNDDGQAGVVIIDDVYLEAAPTTYAAMHNRIDRFTGGVISGALFSEELLWRSTVTLSLSIAEHKDQPVPELARKALQLTLTDLARGWLPLGAGGSRGNGALVATGEWRWSDDGAWINCLAESPQPDVEAVQ